MGWLDHDRLGFNYRLSDLAAARGVAQVERLDGILADRGLWVVEDACEALGGRHADGPAVGARGNLAVFAFYANKQLTTAEGGMVVCPSEAHKERLDSERNQGRAPDMGWLDHDRLGFNYRLSDVQCALGVGQMERLDSMLVERSRVAALYAEALDGVEGLELPCPDAGGDVRGWFVYVVQLPHGVDRDSTIEGLRAQGVDSKPYLPAIHLMSYYRETFGLPIVEDACEGLGAVHADGTPVGGRGHAAVFGFYANKQLTTGEGGMIALADAAMAERLRSERNQGRAPDMGWLDHDRLGFNYRLSDLQAAVGLAQLDRLDGMLADRATVAGWYREALAGLAAERGLGLPCDDAGGDRRGWFVFVVQVPHDGPARDDVVLALRDAGVQSKPYLPAIHLMSFYRERFGHREGEFPVCEDVAARSVALPFHPALRQDEVHRVAEALATALDRTS